MVNHCAACLLWLGVTETRRRRKAPKPPIEATVRLLEWAPKGATRADLDGRAVVVDRGIPGEVVEASFDRRRSPWRGVVTAAVVPSPLRTAPPCPYYLEGCGGCQWQHLEYGAQVETKRSLADRTLEAAGAVARVTRLHAMDLPWRYRHTAAIAIGWEAGFRPRARRGILEIHDCPISHPLIGMLADRLNGLLRGGALPNYHGKVWLDCTVVGTPSDPTVQVVIQGIEGLTLESHPELPSVAETIAGIEVVHSVAYRHRRGHVEALVGPLMATVEVGGCPMVIPAGSFFQTNLVMVPQVLERMRERLAGVVIRGAADVYGGIGTFGLPLAGSVDQMTIIELDPQAVEAARAAAELWGLTNVEVVSSHAERALPGLPALDLIIVDPPRSGLGETVTSALLENGVPLIFYVSCAPGSLAEDLVRLEAGGYRVESLELFDFYPQTYHVESLAILRR
jgi:23S rRNA (uracil1939-C5)-methyltransferase